MYSSQAVVLTMSLFSGKEQLPLPLRESSKQAPLHITTNSAEQDDIVNNAYYTIKHVPCGDKTESGTESDAAIHVHVEMEEEENAYEI